MAEITPIAYIKTNFDTKFGVPRQAGLTNGVGKIIFEPKYRDISALRGLEGFSHIWLIWGFSENSASGNFNPTVRPPRLGGNQRLGVFATRSPFRPNSLGLSCVELAGIDTGSPEAPVIYVKGADLVSGTPVYDIKPYIPYADCRPQAKSGFTAEEIKRYPVYIPQKVAKRFDKDKLKELEEILSLDPRPAFHNDPGRVYGMSFCGEEVKFKVEEGEVLVLE